MKMFKLLLISALFIFSSSAFSHTFITSFTPKSDEALAESPEKLEFQFAQEVRLIKVKVTGSNGQKVDINFSSQAQAATKFQVVLPELSQNSYTVKWIAMGADTHKIKGGWNFEVKSSK